MKKYFFLLWIAINISIIVTMCYTFVSFSLKIRSEHQSNHIKRDEKASAILNELPHLITNRSQLGLETKLNAHRLHVISQLRLSLFQHQSNSKKMPNYYKVHFQGHKNFKKISPEELLCILHSSLGKSNFQVISSKSKIFKDKSNLLRNDHVIKKTYKSCAIVSSAGSLLQSGLGSFIDEHDYVVRFNNAPTFGYESDVGNKTSLRIINSQVVYKPEFNFLNESLFQNVSLLAWDPCMYNSTLEKWSQEPDFPFFERFFTKRRQNQEEELYLLDPRGLWDLWNYLNEQNTLPIPPNPPSSGFIGLALVLPHCHYVDMIEFIPSLRMTKKCHYYDVLEDLGCTVGDWHPLAGEKLLALSLNEADNYKVFHDGFIRITGFPSLCC